MNLAFCFTGMGLQAFIEAFFYLAARRFKSLALREQVVSLLELCESQLGPQSGVEERRSLSCSRALPRTVKTQAPCLANPQLSSPAPLRRAASQDYRHQRFKPRSLRANVENWWEGTSHPTPPQTLPLAFSTGAEELGVHPSSAAPEKDEPMPCWLTRRSTVLLLIAFSSEEEDARRGLLEWKWKKI